MSRKPFVSTTETMEYLTHGRYAENEFCEEKKSVTAEHTLSIFTPESFVNYHFSRYLYVYACVG